MVELKTMNFTPEQKSEMEYLLHITRRWKIVTAVLAIFLVFSTLFFACQLLSLPRIPPRLAQEQMPAGKHRVDIVLIDVSDLTSDEVDAMLRPLIMVADLRMPGQSQHFRILVSAKGFPLGYAAGESPAAAYVPVEDLFLVDIKAVRSAWTEITLSQRWAFAMAHEATHLWQMRRGSLAGKTSNSHNRSAYRRDPIEIEAYEAGLAAANALPGVNFYWSDGEGKMRPPPSPNPYSELADLQVPQRAEVHMSSQTTPLGILRSWTNK